VSIDAIEDLDLIPGSGNVFRDLGEPDADLRQAKAVRAAAERTGFAAADFSRVRRTNLARFTLDRLIWMLQALDPSASVSVRVEPRPESTAC